MINEAALGVKFDSEKPRTDLIPVRPLLGAADVFAYGAKKYHDRNWEKGIKYGKMYGALLRHLFAFWKGEENDPESGKPHMDHAMCEILMLHETRFLHPEMDDRPKLSNNVVVKSSLANQQFFVSRGPSLVESGWCDNCGKGVDNHIKTLDGRYACP